MVTPETAPRQLALDDVTFAAELERRTDGLLGRISACTPRAGFPISGLTARAFAARRVLLVGEAAHVIPPIGAQGLNLGMRDAALACEIIADAGARGEDIGGRVVVEDYDRRRRRDVLPRTVAVDLLNRSLFQSFLPFQGARSAGLYLLERVGPLRRAMMRQGIGPTEDLPRVMRR
jgi:2-octaprenyl-6-methoxyphenol hydroxylase